MSFEKKFKTSIQNVKTTASKAIKFGYPFSCQMVDICINDGDNISYPNSDAMTNFMCKLFTKDLKYKKLNEKALANMAKRGITPKKQPCEILLFIVAGSETHVHVGISVPDGIEFNLNNFIEEITEENVFNVDLSQTIGNEIFVIKYKHESTLKEKDDIQRKIFNELKNLNIYIEEVEDDILYTLE